MANDKYNIPEVSSLREIDFPFEFPRIKDAIPSIKSFVNSGIEKLISLYYPGQFFYDEDGNTIDASFWGDPLLKETELTDEPDLPLVEKIIRLERGEIKPTDYLFLVHPKDKRNSKAILKAANKKLRDIYGATGILIYRTGIWNLDFMDSVKECLYHRVLDDLIRRIADEGQIIPAPWSPKYKKYKEKKAQADEFKQEHDVKTNYFSIAAHYWEADKELIAFNDELFSSTKTLEKVARLTIRKAKLDGPILSSPENKEITITYYLRLQAKEVGVAKDNRKSNKGIQHNKRQQVIDLYIADPKKPITHIVAEIMASSKTIVTRKTASKYIHEYEMGKNNPVKATI